MMDVGGLGPTTHRSPLDHLGMTMQRCVVNFFVGHRSPNGQVGDNRFVCCTLSSGIPHLTVYCTDDFLFIFTEMVLFQAFMDGWECGNP
jgi:hypothetical protein